MNGYDMPNHCKADPGTLHIARRRGAAPNELPKDRLTLRARNAGPFVSYPDRYAAFLNAALQPHRRSLRRILERVIHEIAEGDGERFRIGVDRAYFFRMRNLYAPAGSRDLRFEFSGNAGNQARRISFLDRKSVV